MDDVATQTTLYYKVCVCVCVCVCVSHSDSATPWAVAHRAPLSMELFRQEYWNKLNKNNVKIKNENNVKKLAISL